MELLERLKEYVKSENLIPCPTATILCCVSGGVDSMSLCELLIKAGYCVAIAHCNFTLRGKESDGDEQLVEQYALRKGVALHKIEFDTQEYATQNGVSIQMAARELRYSWFEQIATNFKYSHIAIAHNKGDNIEGFFINLSRGSGIKGLNGMQNSVGKIIRPLMFATRDEIESYATVNGIPYRTDSSNLKTKYLRNKIRLEILPLFREVTPQFDSIMEQNIAKVNESVELLDILLQKVWAECVVKELNAITVDLVRLMEYQKSDFILYQLLSPLGFNRGCCSDIIRGAVKSGLSFYGKNYRAVVDRNALIVKEISSVDGVASVILVESVKSKIEQLRIGVVEVAKSNYKENTSGNIAILDSDKLHFPLTIRPWCEGDKFTPLGMSGEKKISDFLIDSKLSLFEKEKIRVVEDCKGKIVWVVGHRISNLCRIEQDVTQSATILEWLN